MNLSETLQLLDKLRAVGVLRFKSVEMEVDLCKDQPITIHMPKDPIHTASVQQPEPPPPAYDARNTEKVQQTIDLLKMKDEELVNRIFPAGA